MGCLVAGLLALGMLLLAAGVMSAVVAVVDRVSISSDQIVTTIIVVAVGLFLLVLGIVILRRRRAKIRLGQTVWWAIFLFVGTAVIFIMIFLGSLSNREDARAGLCRNNMRLLDHAKEVLAIKNGWTNGQIIADTPDGIWAQFDPYIDGTNLLCCPEAPGRHYIYGAIGVTPRCPLGDKHPDHVYDPR